MFPTYTVQTIAMEDNPLRYEYLNIDRPVVGDLIDANYVARERRTTIDLNRFYDLRIGISHEDRYIVIGVPH